MSETAPRHTVEKEQRNDFVMAVTATVLALGISPLVGWLSFYILTLFFIWWAVLKWLHAPPSTQVSTSKEQVIVNDSTPEGKDDLNGDPLRWSFLPSTGVLRANTHPVESENDFCSIKAVALHKPTHNKARLAKGNYPYSKHMHGRKRIFEIRLQIRFKRVPQGSLHFGIETEYSKSSKESTKRRTDRSKSIILHATRACLGASSTDDFYCSPGDDPSCTDNAEPPTFAFPLWAIDQFHVANPGEEPDLTGNFERLGCCRTDGLTTYISAMHDMMRNISCDKVYTFLFWGVSRFVDVINWQFKGIFPGFRCNFNTLCGQPPLYTVLYELKEDGSKGSEQKHRLARRNYVFKVALWSTLHPPSTPSKAISSILADAAAATEGRQGSEWQAGAAAKLAAKMKALTLRSSEDSDGCCTGFKAILHGFLSRPRAMS